MPNDPCRLIQCRVVAATAHRRHHPTSSNSSNLRRDISRSNLPLLTVALPREEEEEEVVLRMETSINQCHRNNSSKRMPIINNHPCNPLRIVPHRRPAIKGHTLRERLRRMATNNNNRSSNNNRTSARLATTSSTEVNL